MALALFREPRIEVTVRLDERSAAFFALGIALASARPVVMVTTSGTAAAEVHAAVVEADLARLPLLLVTADRPVELHGVGAPQTIDQSRLFPGALRYLLDLPVATEESRPYWRSYGSRLVAESLSGARGPGPVQANLAFREPIVGHVVSVPEGRKDGAPWHEVIRCPSASRETVERLQGIVDGSRRGVLVVGGNPLSDPDAILAFASARRWPVLGDGRAIRRLNHEVLIAHADQFLRSKSVAEALVPDLVIHVGSPHASKTLARWNEAYADSATMHIYIDPFGGFEDPERIGALFLAADPSVIFRSLTGDDRTDPDDWLARWQECDRASERAINAMDVDGVLDEPLIARCVLDALGANDSLFCSSSMPIRDVEWMGSPSHDAPRVLANRGANGIDGIISSTLGVARLSKGRTVGLVGDLALLHDISGFVWGSAEEVPAATFVVIDNSGGGIFSFLDYPDAIEPEIFERGFGTPQAGSIIEAVRALGHNVIEVASRNSLLEALSVTKTLPGISVVIARTDRDANVAVHQQIVKVITAASSAEIARMIGNSSPS